MIKRDDTGKRGNTGATSILEESGLSTVVYFPDLELQLQKWEDVFETTFRVFVLVGLER